MTTPRTPDPRERRYKVLVAHREWAFLGAAERVLSAEVHVVVCTSAEAALALARQQPFHVVCSEADLPGMSGRELLRRISALWSDVGCLLFSNDAAFSEAPEGGRYYVLSVPFKPERLSSVVLELAHIADVRRRSSAPPLRRP
jgi:DNA-binding NtrC family response regulator